MGFVSELGFMPLAEMSNILTEKRDKSVAGEEFSCSLCSCLCLTL